MSNIQKGKLYGLDLFSGIAGNTLGLSDYVKTIAYCETDKHAQAILLSRMGDGSIPIAPIWDDITTLSRTSIDIPIDIIVGGFPCQDISVAGKGAGLEGQRSGLFYEVVRLAKEIEPTFLFLENVPAIRTRGLDRVIEELTEAGYDCRWTMLSAADVGAPHKRERWFCLARRRLSNARSEHDQSNTRSVDQTSCQGQQQIGRNGPHCMGTSQLESIDWKAEPTLDRMVNGVPHQMDRIKRLGNAVVPQQAKIAFEILMGII